LNPRALPLDIAYETAIHYKNDVQVFDSYIDAVDYARIHTPKNGLICCAGSFHLVGHIRHYINFQA